MPLGETDVAIAGTLKQAQRAMGPPLEENLQVEELHRGTILQDRYLIRSRRGAGGMGVVYEAIDRKLGGRRVAIKTVRELSEEALRRFELEGALCAQIDSPYVVRIIDYWMSAAGVPFLLMEFLEGKSVTELLREEKLEVDRAVSLLLCACQAVVEAHACRIYHRDLSAKNIHVMVVRGQELAKVIDWGMSTSDEVSRVTKPGQMLGTPIYMAPERLDGADGGAAADQYSLAMVLYEVVARRSPFERGLTMTQLIAAIAMGELPRADKVADWVPSGLADVLERAMSREPGNRFPSVHAFGKALLPFGGEIARGLHGSFFDGAPPIERMPEQLTGDTTVVKRILRARHEANSNADQEVHDAATGPYKGRAVQEAATVPHDYAAMAARVQQRLEQAGAAKDGLGESTEAKENSGAEQVGSGAQERAWLEAAESRATELEQEIPQRRGLRWLWLLVASAALGGVVVVALASRRTVVSTTTDKPALDLVGQNKGAGRGETDHVRRVEAVAPPPATSSAPLATVDIKPSVPPPRPIAAPPPGVAPQGNQATPSSESGEGAKPVKKRKHLSRKARSEKEPEKGVENVLPAPPSSATVPKGRGDSDPMRLGF